MMPRNSTQVDVRFAYGVGESCGASFPRRAVKGLTARQLLARVIESPQPPGPAARTAVVLASVLQSHRTVDAELINGAPQGPGHPIALDDVIIRGRSKENGQREQETYTIMISESYEGGRGAGS